MKVPKRLPKPKNKFLANLLMNIERLCYTRGISEAEFNAIIKCKESAARNRKKDPRKYTVGELADFASRCKVSIDELFKQII